MKPKYELTENYQWVENPQKYKFTGETKEVDGHTLRRICAVRNISNFHLPAGTVGGWIEEEHNLTQEGDCWVGDDACVYGGSIVQDDALVCIRAQITEESFIQDQSVVGGDARIRCSFVRNRAFISEESVADNARILGDATLHCNAEVVGTTVRDGQFRQGALIASQGDYFVAKSVGSEHGVLTAYRTTSGVIVVRRGCFEGSLSQFAERVERIHGNNIYAQRYRALIEYMKIHFGVSE